MTFSGKILFPCIFLAGLHFASEKNEVKISKRNKSILAKKKIL